MFTDKVFSGENINLKTEDNDNEKETRKDKKELLK